MVIRIGQTLSRMKRIGIIGHSKGNGHIYSWPAIFNGYDRIRMKESGYTIISEYLDKEYKINKNLQGYKVTNIWTQDRDFSEKVACSSNIEVVNTKLKDLIDEVDIVILARDDYRYNLRLAKIIMRKDKNLLIDKPIAIKEADFNKIYSLQKYQGQLFTCSGCRYSENLALTNEEKREIGKISDIKAVVPKEWNKYAIHVLTVGYNLIMPEKVSLISKNSGKNIRAVRYKLDNVDFVVYNTGKLNRGISITVEGDRGCITKVFNDSYKSFSKLLESFIYCVENKEGTITYKETADLVKMIELGQNEENSS